MNSSATIAAIATPPGTGAVAVIRVSGSDAKTISERIFQKKGKGTWKPRHQHFGKIIDSESGYEIDEVLLSWFPAPNSFTGEEVVEISCHGGVVVSRAVLDALFRAGAEPAQPGEFSQRAFLNGKIDLTQAEAIMDLISAQTTLAAKAANQQLAGNLGDELEAIRQNLIGLIAHVEAWIDFPEEDIDPDSSDALKNRSDEIAGQIGELLTTADRGRFLREGVRTVIAGAPNAGKSSLLNLLLGFDRAIVNETAGTTRDTVEEVINLGGIPVRLVDTAGIHEGRDDIEKEGIKRSRSQIEKADLVLFVIDSSVGSEQVESIALPDSARILKILNKSDLPIHPEWQNEESAIRVSCLTDEDKELITQSISEILTVDDIGSDASSLIAINARHQHHLQAAQMELERARQKLSSHDESPEFAAMDLRAALEAIGEIVGKTDVEEILGEIFSSFCIGK